MNNQANWRRRASNGVIAIGGGIAGGGIYGFVLYDLPFNWAIAALVLGFALVGFGVLSGGRIGRH